MDTFQKNCPVCGSKEYGYESYSEFGWGSVEQYGYCDKCGYTIEQAYSPVYEFFSDLRKGFKDRYGIYHTKDVKRHKRNRRKHWNKAKNIIAGSEDMLLIGDWIILLQQIKLRQLYSKI